MDLQVQTYSSTRARDRRRTILNLTPRLADLDPDPPRIRPILRMRLARLKHAIQTQPAHRIRQRFRQRVLHRALARHAPALDPRSRRVEVDGVDDGPGFAAAGGSGVDLVRRGRGGEEIRRWRGRGRGGLGSRLGEGAAGGDDLRWIHYVWVAVRGGGGRVGDFFDAGVGHGCGLAVACGRLRRG
jgi:hypothetical protein